MIIHPLGDTTLATFHTITFLFSVQNRKASENDKKKAVYEDEARRLRKLLRLHFYSAFKWKGNTCYFHFIYCFVFLMQIIKVALLTNQVSGFHTI